MSNEKRLHIPHTSFTTDNNSSIQKEWRESCNKRSNNIKNWKLVVIVTVIRTTRHHNQTAL